MLQANIYFIWGNYSTDIARYLLIGILIASTLYAFILGIAYLLHFRKVYKKDAALSGIQDLISIQWATANEDTIFGRFFNQITSVYYIFMLVTCIDL
jgi:hypothetical protein